MPTLAEAEAIATGRVRDAVLWIHQLRASNGPPKGMPIYPCEEEVHQKIREALDAVVDLTLAKLEARLGVPIEDLLDNRTTIPAPAGEQV